MKKFGFTYVTLLLLLSILAACNQPKFEPQYDWPLGEFTFLNQEGKDFGTADLKGKVWLTNFVFTNCETVCSPMTANMAKLQQQMLEEKVNAEIVSFSVDPNRDTPEVLKEFSRKFDAALTHWHFLTGYKQEEVKKLAKTFKTLAEVEPGTNQFIHSTKIFLINQDGVIVKGYNGLEVPYEEIITDLKALTR